MSVAAADVVRRIGIVPFFLFAAHRGEAFAQPIDGPALPPGAWPGASLEDLRGLRECTLDDPPHRIGAEITCRPPVLPSQTHVSAQVGWVTGLSVAGDDVRGMNGIELAGQFWLTRSLGLGARYQYAGIDARMGSASVGEGLVTAHYRMFTDEVDRDAFTLALGYGWATRPLELGGDGPVARAALTRDIGYMTGEKSSVTWAWEVAVERGLDERAPTAVTAGIRAGFELGIREPRNVGTRDPEPPVRYAIDGEMRASAELGFGASLGFRLSDRLAWRTTAFWTTGNDDDGVHGLRANWGAVTGPRVWIARTGAMLPYVDVQAGPAALGEAGGARLTTIAEGEVGVGFHMFCQTRLDLGVRVQAEVVDGVDARNAFFMLRVEHGTALRRDRDAPECREGRLILR
ncbi:MAG: hypothetical protein KF773_12825 [Deltaproteobacteria bacterium]|nr:hypothetical protein [Deltaproteobacteria bacterium]